MPHSCHAYVAGHGDQRVTPGPELVQTARDLVARLITQISDEEYVLTGSISRWDVLFIYAALEAGLPLRVLIMPDELILEQLIRPDLILWERRKKELAKSDKLPDPEPPGWSTEMVAYAGLLENIHDRQGDVVICDSQDPLNPGSEIDPPRFYVLRNPRVRTGDTVERVDHFKRRGISPVTLWGHYQSLTRKAA